LKNAKIKYATKSIYYAEICLGTYLVLVEIIISIGFIYFYTFSITGTDEILSRPLKEIPGVR